MTEPSPSAEMLRVEVITLFPRMIDAPLAESILGKAQQKGLLRVQSRDLRPYGIGRHNITDDSPYGGGAGMVMKPEPLVAAIEASRQALQPETPAAHPPRVILLDPQGTPFVQATAVRLATESALIFVCGRYEGVDERVRPFVDETLSVGDFVLTGGEFATLCVIDAVARLRPGVLGNDQSSTGESFAQGLLEGPQFTRPVEFRGVRVPEILLSGDHKKVARWRLEQALARTLAVRPDVLERLPLDAEAAEIIKVLRFQARHCIGAPPEVVPGAQVAPGTERPSDRPRPDVDRNEGPGESRSRGEHDAQERD